LDQWKVITGELVDPVHTDLKVPTKEELEIKEAWELCRKRASKEFSY
jgi:hypothetical protein